MKQESGIKTRTVILIAIAVVISLFMVRFLIDDGLSGNENNIDNEIIDNNANNDKEEMEKITLDDPIVKELITLLGKSEGSLVESKDIGAGITSVEELMYYVTDSDASRLDSKIIMYLILNNATITEVEGSYISSSEHGTGYEIGYIVGNNEVQRLLERIFGNNLTTIPNSASEVGVYFINVNGSFVPKYARYNFATGNIELSLNNVVTGGISNYLYLNTYDKVETPDENTLELYEKVIFTSSVIDKDNDNGFRLYKDVMHTEYIAKVNNYALVNGRYRFSEKELNNYINLFAEYKYTFNKDNNGYYHLKRIEKIY